MKSRDHLVYGHTTGNVLGYVRDMGARIECVALVPWLYRNTLDAINGYWDGYFNPVSTPASCALGWFE